MDKTAAEASSGVHLSMVKASAMKRINPFIPCLAITMPAFTTEAQESLLSPQVNSDGRVTFLLRSLNAQTVMLTREGGAQLPMQLYAQGGSVFIIYAMRGGHYAK